MAESILQVTTATLDKALAECKKRGYTVETLSTNAGFTTLKLTCP